MNSIKSEKNTVILYLEKLLKNKSDNFIVQFFRNGITSIIAFVFDFGILYFLTHYYAVHYLISGAISFLIGHIINYVLSIKWVFNERKYESKTVEFTLFLLIGFIGVGFNEAILWVFTDIFHLYYLISKLIAIVIVYFVNFFAKKYILFYIRESK